MHKRINSIVVPVLATAVLFAGSLFAKNKFYDFYKSKVIKYNDSKEQFENKERFVGEDYPNNFVLNYKIPGNNKDLEGGFKLTKNDSLLELLVRIEHTHENQIIKLYETTKGEKGDYYEYKFDFKKGRASFDTSIVGVCFPTLPSIVKDLFSEKGRTHFYFWGQDGEKEKYYYSTSKSETKKGSSVIIAKLEEDASPLVKKVELLIQKGIPTKIDLDYEIKYPLKVFGVDTGIKIPKDITIRGVLTDSLDAKLFEKPE